MAYLVSERVYYWFYPSEFAARVIHWGVSLIEFMLTLRLILGFLGASPSSQFVAWIYSVTGRFVAPFSGAFPNLYFGGFTIELSTIFAMIGYAIIGWLLVQILSFVFLATNRVA